MKLILTLIKLALFLLVLTFAVKNTELVAVRWYMDMEWRAPMVFVVLGAFAIGVVVGLLMTVSSFVRTRAELGRLRRAGRKAVERELAEDDWPAASPSVPAPVSPPSTPPAPIPARLP